MGAEWLYLAGGCFALGMIHAVVPDEHTWPITFSYSVGAASGKGGVRSGAFFATAFTVQRAVMSQLVYFAVAPFLISDESLNGPVYLAVGLAMAAAGYLILRRRLPHWHPLMWISRRDRAKHEEQMEASGSVPVHWALIHGFIAGFGVDVGLFTTFVYLVAVPAMPLAILGFLPGAAFGLGTLAVLMVIGLLFGGSLQVAKRWGAERLELFGAKVGARSLLYGGALFAISGLLFMLGLDSVLPVEFGNLLVFVFMVGIIVPVMVYTWREVKLAEVGKATVTGP
ncbi:MAG: hypothetical protein HY297_04610 [Thaumarchaeota archaeon]|nr:hypothetical protein [Nitrososphaerota archaeon]